jgi:phosphatidylinositol alpha 1,6-mannosyltransferase
MRPGAPRVAYFPDSFYEVNGVAHTSRHFEAFARRRRLPFLCVRAGERLERYAREDDLASLELKRGLLSFALDKDLRFDPAFARHLPAMVRAVRAFRPEIIHITGPSELGLLGALLAHHFRVPLVASWHTNVHEYAARRSLWLLRKLSKEKAPVGSLTIERSALSLTARFYKLARILFAPNVQLCELLEQSTGRRCYLMPRGVDTELFSPAHRGRGASDREFVLGFVGRLSVEKNVALLADVQHRLEALGVRNFRFLIIGQGAEESWLRANLPRAAMPGVLRGGALSRAYADMDLFVFPSHTDTFGNVVLEALASGVPAIVTPDGGPRYIVRDGETGFVADDAEFAEACARVLRNPALHAEMRVRAREHALSASWDAVFEGVYAAYGEMLADTGY